MKDCYFHIRVPNPFILFWRLLYLNIFLCSLITTCLLSCSKVMFSAMFVCLSSCPFTMGSHVTHACNALGQSQVTWKPPFPVRPPPTWSPHHSGTPSTMTLKKLNAEAHAIHTGTSPYKHHSNLFNLGLPTQGLPPRDWMESGRLALN